VLLEDLNYTQKKKKSTLLLFEYGLFPPKFSLRLVLQGNSVQRWQNFETVIEPGTGGSHL
jgi:hypothetical protein